VASAIRPPSSLFLSLLVPPAILGRPTPESTRKDVLHSSIGAWCSSFNAIGGNWKTYNLWILGRWIRIREEQQHETGEDQRTGEEEDERLNCSDAAWLLNLSDNPNPLR
jgi:hypothetical protein